MPKKLHRHTLQLIIELPITLCSVHKFSAMCVSRMCGLFEGIRDFTNQLVLSRLSKLCTRQGKVKVKVGEMPFICKSDLQKKTTQISNSISGPEQKNKKSEKGKPQKENRGVQIFIYPSLRKERNALQKKE